MPPLPACPAYLIQNNQLITSNERQLLSTAISRKALLDYLQRRHKWTPHTMQKVNLEAFQAARKRCQPHMARFVARFVHGHLPTRYRCCIMGSAPTDQCPLCNQLETQDHLFLCPQQHQWRADFLEQLSQHLIATQTEPTLQTAVCETMTDWLEDVRPRRRPTAITQHQHAIGFHLLHRGYICTDWTRRQEAHEPDKGHAWTRDLIIFLWNAAYELWTLRNSALHGPDNTLARHQELKAAAIELYEMQDQTLAQDRHNFNIPLTERLAHSPRRLHNYIQAQAPVILHSVAQAFQRATRGARRITDYFTRANGG
jgi:hypothetical protein